MSIPSPRPSPRLLLALPVALALSTGSAGAFQAPSWVEGEEGILAHHVQLTPSSRFRKAGESYFSPDGSKIIFQAVEREDDPAQEEAFYQMFVADVVVSGGHISGLTNFVQVSTPGSSNTWYSGPVW